MDNLGSHKGAAVSKAIRQARAHLLLLPPYSPDLTQTVYDANGDVVYGRSGVGDFIRECVFAMTTSEKSADRERCKK